MGDIDLELERQNFNQNRCIFVYSLHFIACCYTPVRSHEQAPKHNSKGKIIYKLQYNTPI